MGEKPCLPDCDAIAAELDRSRRLNESLAARLAAASEVLGRLAERNGHVAEILRMRLALERIAVGCSNAVLEAQLAIGWEYLPLKEKFQHGIKTQ